MKKFTLLIFLFSSLYSVAQDYKPEDTEVWEPKPKVVTPGELPGAPPSDAVVLFDGSDTDEWQKPQFNGESLSARGVASGLSSYIEKDSEAIEWKVKKGELEVKPRTGAIESKRKFGSCQLHIEWLSPVDQGKTGQGYSNSGIFFMSLYELQVLNSYKNETYSNGQAGSIYKQHPPLVNASKPPGEWQIYDIIFTAPTFDEIGNLVSPASVTAFHNGVLIQNNVTLKGPTVYIGPAHYSPHPEKLPLRLQDHGDKVRYRNIWIREL